MKCKKTKSQEVGDRAHKLITWALATCLSCALALPAPALAYAAEGSSVSAQYDAAGDVSPDGGEVNQDPGQGGSADNTPSTPPEDNNAVDTPGEQDPDVPPSGTDGEDPSEIPGEGGTTDPSDAPADGDIDTDDNADVDVDADSEAKTDSDVVDDAEVDAVSALALTGAASVPSLGTLSTMLNQEKRVDVVGGSTASGAALQIYSDNATPAQRFRFKPVSGDEGYYTIVNVKSGKVLDVANARTTDGTPVQQYGANETEAQRWRFVDAGDGSYYIVSKLRKSLVLDIRGASSSNGTPLQVYTANKSKAQRFRVNSIQRSVGNGSFQLGCAATSTVADIQGASADNGANAQMYKANSTVAQLFSVSYDESNGYYTLGTFAGGKVLDVVGGSTVNGANVQQYASNNTYAQKWSIEPSSRAGYYTLRSALSGLALDVVGASGASGANVQLYASNGTAAQQWSFDKQKVAALKPGLYTLNSALNSSFVLDVAGASLGNYANIQLYQANNTWAQKFTVEVLSDGNCVIRSLKSNKVLDVNAAGQSNGTNVQQYDYNGSNAQLWKPVYYGGSAYGFVSKCNGLFLDVYGAQTKNYANVQVWAGNGSLAQRFVLSPTDKTTDISEGAYIVSSVKDGRALDIQSASTDNGAAVQTWESNNTYAQKFKMLSAGSNAYYCVNVHSSKYLDVDTGTKARVQQWDRTTATNQCWTFTPVDNTENTYYIKSAYTGKYLTNNGSGSLSLAAYTGTTAQQFKLTSTVAFKVYLDAGHGYNSNGGGGFDVGAVSLGYRECDLTSDLVNRIGKQLSSRGIEYYVGYGKPFRERHQDAVNMGCSTFLSIHFNAGGGTGIESYIHSYNAAAGSSTYQNVIHPYLATGTSLYDRGKKRAELAVCGGRLPSVLLEVAYIDNMADMSTYGNRKDTVARFLAAGLQEASANRACGWY